MITRIQGWGNSQGLRINKQIMKQAKISVGDEVALCVREGAIIIEPVKKVRGTYTLEELVAKIPSGYKPNEVNWGTPAGREVW